MTDNQEISNWRAASDFFFRQELETVLEYNRGRITLRERNLRLKNINQGWHQSMLENNPFLKKITSKISKIFD